MDVHNNLSSDISANLMVASIAEELTKAIRKIKIDKPNRNKILGNILEINTIVEESKSQQKFENFKAQLEEIQSILNEPIHKSWMDKLLAKTEYLIEFMRKSEKSESEPQKVRQSCQHLNTASGIEHGEGKHLLSLQSPIHPLLRDKIPLGEKSSDMNWESGKNFGSESEVLIVNYSGLQHELSLAGSAAREKMENDKITDLQKQNDEKKIDRKSAFSKTPGSMIKKSKQISLKNVVNPTTKSSVCTNRILLDKSSNKEKNRYIETKNLMGATQELNALKSELHKQLTKKLCEFEIGNSRHHTQDRKVFEDPTMASRCQSKKIIKDEKDVKKSVKKDNVKKSDEMSKSKGKKERKCNISGVPLKEKEKLPTQSIICIKSDKYLTKKFNRIGPSPSNMTTSTQTPKSMKSTSSPTNRTTIDTSENTLYKTQEVLKLIAPLSYKKLLPGNGYSNSKAEEILTRENDSLDKMKNRDNKKSKTKRRRTLHRRKKNCFKSADDFEDLKIRCQSIRRELESIENEAGFIKNKKREEEVAGETGNNLATAQESHLGYLCSIM